MQTYVESEVHRELAKSAQDGAMPDARLTREMTERMEQAASALVEAAKDLRARDTDFKAGLVEELRSVLRDELAGSAAWASAADAQPMPAGQRPMQGRRAVLLWALGFLCVGALAFVAGAVAPEPTRAVVTSILDQVQSQVVGTDTPVR